MEHLFSFIYNLFYQHVIFALFPMQRHEDFLRILLDLISKILPGHAAGHGDSCRHTATVLG
jgi:hypothetical protein